MVTNTTEAANELRERLPKHIGNLVQSKLRTMASILVKSAQGALQMCNRLIVDEGTTLVQ